MKDGKKRTLDFLKAAGTYFLATDDGGQPRVRPFGTIHEYNGSLYIQTGKKKKVSREIHANPRIEISAMLDGDWIRLSAEAYEDDRREARVSMLESYPELKAMYDPDDGNTEVFALKNCKVTIASFTKPEEHHDF